MELLVIVLNKEEYLEDILSIMVELDISQATIIDSEGMAHALAYDVPIFAGLKNVFSEAKEQNKTIFSLVKDKNIISKFKRLLKEEDIDFSKSGAGIMFTVPVNEVIE